MEGDEKDERERKKFNNNLFSTFLLSPVLPFSPFFIILFIVLFSLNLPFLPFKHIILLTLYLLTHPLAQIPSGHKLFCIFVYSW